MSENSSLFQAPLNAALQHAMQHLSPESDVPVAATADLDTLRSRLRLPLGETGVDPTVVIDDLVRGVKGGIIDSAGPRFFGWVIGGSLPAALAADWLTSAWDQNAGMYSSAPAAAVVEEVAGEWLKDLLASSGDGELWACHRMSDGSCDLPCGGATCVAGSTGMGRRDGGTCGFSSDSHSDEYGIARNDGESGAAAGIGTEAYRRPARGRRGQVARGCV